VLHINLNYGTTQYRRLESITEPPRQGHRESNQLNNNMYNLM